MRTEFDTVLSPVLTEKSQILQKLHQYTFVVHQDANKQQVKDAIQKIFAVEISCVRMLKKPHKMKVFKGRIGKRKGYKKAIVSIPNNQTIDLEKYISSSHGDTQI